MVPADVGPTEYRLLQFFMTHQTTYTQACWIMLGWECLWKSVPLTFIFAAVWRRENREINQTVRGTGYRFSEKELSLNKRWFRQLIKRLTVFDGVLGWLADDMILVF